jgi:hypothetical protein
MQKETPVRKEQTQIRMDKGMKERVRRFIEKFENTTKAEIGFSEAVRVLLERALKHEGIQ